MPVDARRQFLILYRDALSRVIDPGLLSDLGDVQRLFAQAAALMLAFGFTFSLVVVPRYIFSSWPAARLAVSAQSDEEFFISTTMALAGLVCVLAWNNVMPDRRDSFILRLLPLRARTIAMARIATVITVLLVCVAALNLFTGLCYPFIATGGGGFVAGVRAFLAYWVTLAVAAISVFAGWLAVQGILLSVLGYRWFLKTSSWVQMAAFFVTLSTWFFDPRFPRSVGAENGPSYWFFGLFQLLSGVPEAAFARLAPRALLFCSMSIGIATLGFALAYGRGMRRMIEQPDIAPADRSRPAARVLTQIADWFVRDPLDRAILLFAGRTAARSPQHRLLLAAYGGIGLAIALILARGEAWRTPSTGWIAASFALLCWFLPGVRASFTLPFVMAANWAFRVSVVHAPERYFRAARKTLYTVGAAPVMIVLSAVFLSIWPARDAFRHLAVLAAVCVILTELMIYRFRKIPFTCSYLPGKANLNIKSGIYLLLFLFTLRIGSLIEWGCLGLREPGAY